MHKKAAKKFEEDEFDDYFELDDCFDFSEYDDIRPRESLQPRCPRFALHEFSSIDLFESKDWLTCTGVHCQDLFRSGLP